MNLFIFGTKRNAELAKFYFQRDYPNFNLVGFVEDRPECKEAFGLPVFETEQFIKLYPAGECLLFAPLTRSSARKRVYERFKSLGYKFASYVSPSASIWDPEIVGENCFIQELNNIQFGTFIGENCLFWAGNHIGHHGVIGAHTTFTSHVVLSGGCTIGEQCYFGVNSTIGDGLNLCNNIFVGMGAVVTKSLAQEGVYVGSPAKFLRSSDQII